MVFVAPCSGLSRRKPGLNCCMETHPPGGRGGGEGVGKGKDEVAGAPPPTHTHDGYLHHTYLPTYEPDMENIPAHSALYPAALSHSHRNNKP